LHWKSLKAYDVSENKIGTILELWKKESMEKIKNGKIMNLKA
jgi:hypothetical protein